MGVYDEGAATRELRTERVVLRPWCACDAAALYELASDSRIGPRAGWPCHESVEMSARIIHDVLAVPDSFAMVSRKTGVLMGAIGLTHAEYSDVAQDGEMELGYWIGVPYQGKGLTTEAAREVLRYGFENLGLSAIWACYYDGNEPSRRVQEKCGFVYHHSYESDVPLLGERRLTHCLRRTREDWLAGAGA